MLGRPVTHELIRAGFEVTILARDVRKAEKEFSGCTIVQGDLGDPGLDDVHRHGDADEPGRAHEHVAGLGPDRLGRQLAVVAVVA